MQGSLMTICGTTTSGRWLELKPNLLYRFVQAYPAVRAPHYH
jgi:hypothetical protein